MVKTIYNNGSKVYAAWVNAMQNLVFDDQDIDGHYPRLTNDALSNVAGQIKPEWLGFRDALKVTAATGLSVSYLGGTAILPSNTLQTVAPGTIGIANNATEIVYINSTGAIAVAAAASLPVIRFELAQVTTVAGSITAIADLRAIANRRILPPIEAIKIFGGSGDQGDFTCVGTQSLNDAEYWYRDFSVPSGTTLNIASATKIYCSGNVSIGGNVVVGSPMKGGQSSVGSSNQFFQTAGQGQGRASDFLGGGAYNYTVSPLGGGGATGTATGTTGSAFSVSFEAGNGGGAIVFEAGGSITVAATATISAKGTNAVATVIGNATGLSNATGSGAGSGGLIILKSLRSIVCAGTLDVRGGNGSPALQAAASTKSNGGGGGAGGNIGLFAPTINTTGATILLSGGTPGASVTNGSPVASVGGGGGGGFGGGGGANEAAGTVGILLTRTIRPTV